eukprot:TRINITY_DN23216_c0_g1_i1.p1 TRINITY_DN23216_c0_g1~~TRINITY_DN23216_c0_g1_i1.p1  ORF type:complete len:871 (-),score=151.94 TRINITY_DN23216_c0_g1_i1:88-2700(-)
MSMDPVVLGILGLACKEELQLFELVRVFHKSPQGQSCFLCIGRHHMFFVAKEMDILVEGEKLSYLSIDKAVTDTSTRRFFLLKLTYDKEATWDCGDRIFVESQHREMMLERIGLCWQAEYMLRKFQVEKFPQAKAPIGEQLPGIVGSSKHNIDLLQVKPFKEYEDTFKHRGYSFFLRSGFQSSSGLKQGTFVHDTGWTVSYNSQPVVVPPGVQITVHVHDVVPIMELEKSATGADDIRTIATEYKQAITDCLDQFYVLVNCAYMKRMNRNSDVASWDGWEFFVRSKEFVFVCIMFRREYIPPLCDTVQDIAVLLRCPAQNMRHDACEVLLDECRFVADSLASTAEAKTPYRELIQARLDTLQFNEEAYRWLEGNLKLTPVHRKPAALKFVKSIVHILITDGQIWDELLIDDEIFHDIPVLHNPLLVPQQMMSDAETLLGDGEDREERRNAWFWRISRYLAFCVDGGIVGERFSLAKMVQAVGKGSFETDKQLRAVLEFLLHVVPRGDWKRPFSSARMPLSQLLQSPSEFGSYMFNERVMRVLLSENYIQNEWGKKKASGSGSSYEKLLSALLVSENVGIGLRTLICRQILETIGTERKENEEDAKVQVLVPALVKVMQSGNLSLTSCATAALVNLSCGSANTKTLLVSRGVLNLCMKQLKAKDDDLTLYTLYLLVNLTKTPHHRAIVVREGAVPLLVDILTSSYQNLRKQKILTEVASVLGQLCNDRETRSCISEDFPVVPCLLWIFDAAQPNTKLKSKLVFALRQLCVLAQNKIKVGQHVIPMVLDELGQATPAFEECAMNSVLLLTMLANIHSNALMMHDQGKLDDALQRSGIVTIAGQKARFGPLLMEKVMVLKERIKESVIASGGS